MVQPASHCSAARISCLNIVLELKHYAFAESLFAEGIAESLAQFGLFRKWETPATRSN
jgi:hypothetical protein